MSFTFEEFGNRRPYLYHVIARRNLCGLRATRVLYSAATLAKRAGRDDTIAERRRSSAAVCVDGRVAVLRDQAPLSMGSVCFEGGWGRASLLRALGEHVFFWPGTEQGPVRCGRNHFAKYAESDVVLRLPFSAVADQKPMFCRFNSGAPRCSGGRKSPRGPNTFADAASCSFAPASVVEVVFRSELRLPDETAVLSTPTGSWRRFS
jgi:hypothetical protein